MTWWHLTLSFLVAPSRRVLRAGDEFSEPLEVEMRRSAEGPRELIACMTSKQLAPITGTAVVRVCAADEEWRHVGHLWLRRLDISAEVYRSNQLSGDQCYPRTTRD